MIFNNKVSFRNVNVNTSGTANSSRGSVSGFLDDPFVVKQKKNKTIGIRAYPVSKLTKDMNSLSPRLASPHQNKSDGRIVISPVKVNRSKFSDQNLRLSALEDFTHHKPMSRNNVLPPINLSYKSPLKSPKSPKSPINGGMKNNYSTNESYHNFSLDQNDSRYEMLTSQTYNSDINLNNLNSFYKDYEPSKCSTKPNGIIKAYSVNTYQGIHRNYNEDRVSVVLNIAKPDGYFGVWPKCHFYGLYDGHGGNTCADFLRDTLHEYIIKDLLFLDNPVQALKNGFKRAEEYFLNHIAVDVKGQLQDISGSCALVCLIIGDICYTANSGDSRALCSIDGGKSIKVLTNDHKPSSEPERKRIVENGGRVYK
jgi:hypothetical protein